MTDKLLSVFTKAGIVRGQNSTFPSIQKAVDYINSLDDSHLGAHDKHAAQSVQFSESALAHRSHVATKEIQQSMKSKFTRKKHVPLDEENVPDDDNGTNHKDDNMGNGDDSKDEEVGFEDTVR